MTRRSATKRREYTMAAAPWAAIHVMAKRRVPTPDAASPLAAAADVVAHPVESSRRAWEIFQLTIKRSWAQMAEDDIFFLAGGIAFNVLLAILPFVLLLVAALTFVLGLSPDASAEEIRQLIARFLPPAAAAPGSPIHDVINEAIRTRGAAGVYGSLIYLWFSTRLFGSLRTSLANVFDRKGDRGVFWGKFFDVRLTFYSTVLMIAYVGLSLYLAVARSRGVSLLVALGFREDVMGALEYAIGRIVAFAFITALFFALYWFLPKRRIATRQALVGALTSGVLFELARNVWTALTKSYDPGSLYSGTLYAVVSVVFWVYYGALLFLVGAEVSQAFELSRAEVRQRIDEKSGEDGFRSK